MVVKPRALREVVQVVVPLTSLKVSLCRASPTRIRSPVVDPGRLAQEVAKMRNVDFMLEIIIAG